MIKRGQIFCRSPTAGHDDDIHTASLIEIANSRRYFGSRFGTLYLGWKNQDVRALMTPQQNVQNVPQCSRLRRSHNANSLGQRGDWLLASGIKQPLPFQFGLELFKSNL